MFYSHREPEILIQLGNTMMFISWYLFFSTVAVLYYYMCVKMIKRYEDLRDFLSNIKNRESDFEQFILPQKDNADVIIKFFTIDDIDLQNLNVNPKLSLELLIDKSFNIKHILKKLSDNKIEFDLQDENRFNKVTFLNYKRLIFFDINKNYTFYDYILYFILNLNYNG